VLRHNNGYSRQPLRIVYAFALYNYNANSNYDYTLERLKKTTITQLIELEMNL